MSCSDSIPSGTTSQATAAAPAIAISAPAAVAAMPRINEQAPPFCAKTTHGVVTPEASQPSDKIIVGAPRTMADVKARFTAGLEIPDGDFHRQGSLA